MKKIGLALPRASTARIGDQTTVEYDAFERSVYGWLGFLRIGHHGSSVTSAKTKRRDDEDEDEDEELSDVSNSTSPATSRSPSNRYRKNRRSDITFGSLNEKLKEHEEEEEKDNSRSSVSSTRSLDPLRLGEVLLDFLQVYGVYHSIFLDDRLTTH